MRNSIPWLASALLVALLVGDRAGAQPPRGRRGPPGRFGPPGGPSGGLERAVDDLKLSGSKRETALSAIRAYQENLRRLTELTGASLVLQMKEIVTPEEFKKLREATSSFRSSRVGPRRPETEDVVERLLSFDKNKDSKLTRDELPERMQDLIAKGDSNKDGALDRDEIKKLAADVSQNDRFGGRGPRGRFPPGPGGRDAGAGGVPLGVIERAVGDLRLVEKKKETANAAVKATQENVRKLRELAGADLLVKLMDVLSEEELKQFKAVLDRQPADRPLRPDRRPGPFRPGRP